MAGPVKAKTTVKDCKALIEYGKHLQDEVRTPGNAATLPLVAYYGTGRLWNRKKLTDGDLKRSSRTVGYTDCLAPGSSYKSFAKWFSYWVESSLDERYNAMKEGRPPQAGEFDGYIASVNNAVNECLRVSGWERLDYSNRRKELVAIHKVHGELPVSMLSDGIRNMIGMVADIAFRATKLNPQLGEDAAKNTAGIVLIDEVGMHLHPEWQQIVLASLLRAFPNIQFIVTTHSPQVQTTVHREHIRVIEAADSRATALPPAGETYLGTNPVALNSFRGLQLSASGGRLPSFISAREEHPS